MQLITISDGRVNPSIPLPTILKVLFSAMALKVHSFNLVESYLREGYFNKFLGSAGFGISADTFGYALARTTLREFREINDSVIKKAHYGKVYQGGTIDGFKVTALDGSEVFRTKHKSWSCEKCRITETTKEDGTKETQYHEDIVGACYVGRHPNLVLGLERINRGEGEISTAMRLLKELNRRHNRYTDIITLDSLYAKAPIINEIIAQNMIAVIRVKPTETLWRILHRRWDIENKAFHDLKKFWGFGHNYHHDPTAFMVMLYLAVIAMNLTFLFYHRRLPASFKRQNSLLLLREMIKITFWSVSKELWDPG